MDFVLESEDESSEKMEEGKIPHQLLSILSTLQETGFSDAQIKGDVRLISGRDKIEVRLDSLLLAAVSPSFLSMMEPHFDSCEDIVIIFSEVSGSEITSFVKYLYTGESSNITTPSHELMKYLSVKQHKPDDITSFNADTVKKEKSGDKNNTTKPNFREIKKLINENSTSISYIHLNSHKQNFNSNFQQIVYEGCAVDFVKCVQCSQILRYSYLDTKYLARHLKVHKMKKKLTDENSEIKIDDCINEDIDIELRDEDLDILIPSSQLKENMINSNLQISKVVVEKLIQVKSNRIRMICVDSKFQSPVWNMFDKLEVDCVNVPYVCCKSCKKVYIFSREEGTSSLLRHVCDKPTRKNKMNQTRELLQQLVNSKSNRIELVSMENKYENLVPGLDSVFTCCAIDAKKSKFICCKHCNKLFSLPSPKDSVLIRQIEDHDCYIKFSQHFADLQLLHSIQIDNPYSLRIIQVHQPDRISILEKISNEHTLYHFSLDGEKSSQFGYCVKCERFFSLRDDKNASSKTSKVHRCQKQVASLREKFCISCDLCHEEFRSKHFLEIHMRQLHQEGTARVLCSYCGKDFATDNLARKHELHVHNPDSRKFKCSFEGCMMSFHENYKLKMHSLTHQTGKKPFVCDLCGKDFNWATSFQDHMDMHSNTRKFNCDFCGKSFVKRNTFNNHRRLHTGEKPFLCPAPDCGMSFVQRTACKTHARKKHGIHITVYTRNPNLPRTAASRAQTNRMERFKGASSYEIAVDNTNKEVTTEIKDLETDKTFVQHYEVISAEFVNKVDCGEGSVQIAQLPDGQVVQFIPISSTQLSTPSLIKQEMANVKL